MADEDLRLNCVVAPEECNTDKQNISVILVPESVLQALRNSSYTGVSTSDDGLTNYVPAMLFSDGPQATDPSPQDYSKNHTRIFLPQNVNDEIVNNLIQNDTNNCNQDIGESSGTSSPNTSSCLIQNPCSINLTKSSSSNAQIVNNFFPISMSNNSLSVPSAVDREGTERDVINSSLPAQLSSFPGGSTAILVNSVAAPKTIPSVSAGTHLSTVDTTGKVLTMGDPFSSNDRQILLYMNCSDIQQLSTSTTDHQTQTSPRAYKCTVFNCRKKFQTNEELLAHEKVHMTAKIYKCNHPDCPWSFKTPYKLKRHLESHKQNKQFNCKYPGCLKTCSTSYNLRVHEKMHLDENNLKCKLCQQQFRDKHKLHKHIRQLHDTEPKLVCSYDNCDRKFHTASALASHMHAHIHPKTEYTCYVCGRKFSRPSTFKEHLYLHTGERPFKCDYPDCNWAFMAMSKLNRHRQTHTAAKRFFCPVDSCKSGFNRLEHLKSHLKVHSAKAKQTKDGSEGTDDPDLPIESSEDNLVYFLCPYEECGSLFTTLIGAKQHIQKLHSSSIKSSNDTPVSTIENDPVSITLETAKETEEYMTPTTSNCKVAVYLTNEENGVQQSGCNSDSGNVLMNDVLNSQPKASLTIATSGLEFTETDFGSQAFSSKTPEDMGLNPEQEFPLSTEEPLSSHMDPADYLLVSSRDFTPGTSDVPQDLSHSVPMDFIAMNQVVYSKANSEDPFLNLSECVPTVDPNIVMSAPTTNQASTSGRSTFTYDEDDDNNGCDGQDFNNMNTEGSARTDCNAYYRARLGKHKIVSKTLNTNRNDFPLKKQLDINKNHLSLENNSGKCDDNFDIAICSFMFKDSQRKENNEDQNMEPACSSAYECDQATSNVNPQVNEENTRLLSHCQDEFNRSTINLSDLV